jgi:hypothetical protein
MMLLLNKLCDHTLSSVDSLARHYPCARVLMVGDFNSIETNMFNKYLGFKQMVTCPTRGNNTLEILKNNCNNYYSVPVVLPLTG